MDKKKRIVRVVVIALIVLAVAGGIKAWTYLSEYYEAEPEATAVLDAGEEAGYIYASENDSENLILKADGDTDTGILFYPGGKVEYTAYLPMLEQLREAGYDVVLIKMPFNLAFFDMNAGEKVLSDMSEELPNVTKWYAMGHSLGGVSVSKFAAVHADMLEGLILLGSFDYGLYDEENTLIIYGSEDVQLDTSKINENLSDVLEIEGGNHAWFGYYGNQEGDGEATISKEEQQSITVNEICSWIQSHEDNQ